MAAEPEPIEDEEPTLALERAVRELGSQIANGLEDLRLDLHRDLERLADRIDAAARPLPVIAGILEEMRGPAQALYAINRLAGHRGLELPSVLETMNDVGVSLHAVQEPLNRIAATLNEVVANLPGEAATRTPAKG